MRGARSAVHGRSLAGTIDFQGFTANQSQQKESATFVFVWPHFHSPNYVWSTNGTSDLCFTLRTYGFSCFGVSMLKESLWPNQTRTWQRGQIQTVFASVQVLLLTLVEHPFPLQLSRLRDDVLNLHRPTPAFKCSVCVCVCYHSFFRFHLMSLPKGLGEKSLHCRAS